MMRRFSDSRKSAPSPSRGESSSGKPLPSRVAPPAPPIMIMDGLPGSFLPHLENQVFDTNYKRMAYGVDDKRVILDKKISNLGGGPKDSHRNRTETLLHRLAKSTYEFYTASELRNRGESPPYFRKLFDEKEEEELKQQLGLGDEARTENSTFCGTTLVPMWRYTPENRNKYGSMLEVQYNATHRMKSEFAYGFFAFRRGLTLAGSLLYFKPFINGEYDSISYCLFYYDNFKNKGKRMKHDPGVEYSLLVLLRAQDQTVPGILRFGTEGYYEGIKFGMQML